MARNKIGLQFSGFKEAIAQLEKLEGDVKGITEAALYESKKVVTGELLKTAEKKNYPAQGKYSSGDVRHSIDLSKDVEWEGFVASIPVGFDLKKGGFPSIFLMYGTPRMPKVQGMYDAIYGSKIRRKIGKIQKEIFQKAIRERMG